MANKDTMPITMLEHVIVLCMRVFQIGLFGSLALGAYFFLGDHVIELILKLATGVVFGLAIFIHVPKAVSNLKEILALKKMIE